VPAGCFAQKCTHRGHFTLSLSPALMFTQGLAVRGTCANIPILDSQYTAALELAVLRKDMTLVDRIVVEARG
jgi:hypothetical protein